MLLILGIIMTSEKIIDILKNGKIHLSCELFPPKQGVELQNSLEIVNKIAASKPSYERHLWRRRQHGRLFGGTGEKGTG